MAELRITGRMQAGQETLDQGIRALDIVVTAGGTFVVSASGAWNGGLASYRLDGTGGGVLVDTDLYRGPEATAARVTAGGILLGGGALLTGASGRLWGRSIGGDGAIGGLSGIDFADGVRFGRPAAAWDSGTGLLVLADADSGTLRWFADRGAGYAPGGAGADVLRGGAGADTILGGAGTDSVAGGRGADVIGLGAGDDLFTDLPQGGPSGGDRVRGGAGDDVLLGRGGADRLRGEAGADRIEGGAGNDLLSGGRGADRRAARATTPSRAAAARTGSGCAKETTCSGPRRGTGRATRSSAAAGPTGSSSAGGPTRPRADRAPTVSPAAPGPTACRGGGSRPPGGRAGRRCRRGRKGQ